MTTQNRKTTFVIIIIKIYSYDDIFYYNVESRTRHKSNIYAPNEHKKGVYEGGARKAFNK